MSTSSASEIITLQEVSNILGVSQRTVYNLIARKVITPIPQPSDGVLRVHKKRFYRSDIEKLAAVPGNPGQSK